jgi:hypothetical protein
MLPMRQEGCKLCKEQHYKQERPKNFKMLMLKL